MNGRYRSFLLPLGFEFDVDAVIVSGVAHRTQCKLLPPRLPPTATAIGASGVYRSERCPRECPGCRPPFETLLTYQLERTMPLRAEWC
jgi:hypothetical protein